MLETKADNEICLNPILAYDRIAPEFEQLSNHRRAYLAGIEQLVISKIPHSSCSLLDLGAGDGTRALRIAKATGIKNLVLLEPSAEMRKKWPAHVRGWSMRAEDLAERDETFDVITCLWNVLGHLSPHSSRIEVMRHCARLLAPDGRLFLDVNYRYNAAHYGLVPTALRILRDLARPDEQNGDVIVRWKIDGTTYATNGHVFTHSELRRMLRSAGLMLEKQFTVSYSTGKIHRSQLAGNPLYILRRTMVNGSSV